MLKITPSKMQSQKRKPRLTDDVMSRCLVPSERVSPYSHVVGQKRKPRLTDDVRIRRNAPGRHKASTHLQNRRGRTRRLRNLRSAERVLRPNGRQKRRLMRPL